MSGYSCLRGASRVQLAMLIAMLIYIGVPDGEDFSDIANEAYFLCCLMHLTFCILHVFTYINFPIEGPMSIAVIG